MADDVSFDVTREEFDTIYKIANRAASVFGFPADGNRITNLAMSIAACHANGNPLRLDDLLAADDANLGHDVSGIDRFVCHETGELTNCFLPRFSMGEAAQ